ncbi:transposase [Streptomyces sioyaensis]|uniref:transposase n=1 Tax=Streptomyces sioyaensis TaxID=67364 RepID=UPI0037D33B79
MWTIVDGAMGLWRALAQAFPQPRHQRCWVHRTRNVTDALPKSAQPGAKEALREIYNAEDRAHAENAVTAFAKAYGAKCPKAVAKITDDVEELLAFYDFPAEHWHTSDRAPDHPEFATATSTASASPATSSTSTATSPETPSPQETIPNGLVKPVR